MTPNFCAQHRPQSDPRSLPSCCFLDDDDDDNHNHDHHHNHATCERSRPQGFAELVLERDQEDTSGGDTDEDETGGGGSSSDDLYTLPEILSAVRRACLSRAAVPVLCGSSLRGIGVEPLLDSVSTFLPSPLDRPPPTGIVREASASPRGGGGGGGGKERRRQKGVAAGGGGGGGGAAFDVDPLRDDLVAFVFKVQLV